MTPATKQRKRYGRRQEAAIRDVSRDLQRVLPLVYKPYLHSPPPALTHQQVRTLCALDRTEPIRVTDLAARMGIKKSATSIMVSRLVTMGLAWKERAIEDKRIVLVRLTGEGERMREAPAAVDVARVEEKVREHGLQWSYVVRSKLTRLASMNEHGMVTCLPVSALARPPFHDRE